MVSSAGCPICGGWSTAGPAHARPVGRCGRWGNGSQCEQMRRANAYDSGYTAGSVNTAYAMRAMYPTVPPSGWVQPTEWMGAGQSSGHNLLLMREHMVSTGRRCELRVLSRRAGPRLIGFSMMAWS